MELLPYTLKWFEVLLRWSHVLFAILWVGNSFLFNYLDNKLEKNIKKQLLNFRKYIEKNCRNVGDNFAREARSIHYEKKNSQGIYGKTTPEEASELIEEGIEVVTVPWVHKSEN